MRPAATPSALTMMLLPLLACLLLPAPGPAAALDLRAAVADAARAVPMVAGPLPPARAGPPPAPPPPPALGLQDWNPAGVAVVGNNGRRPGPQPGAGSSSRSWSHCGDSSDILHIKRLDLRPDPPKRGEDLLIDGKAYLEEDIVQGATAHVRVKIGPIQFLDKVFDLCEQLNDKGNDRLKCPIERGDIEVSELVHLPKEIPPGRYAIHLNVQNADKKPVTCVNARFVF